MGKDLGEELNEWLEELKTLFKGIGNELMVVWLPGTVKRIDLGIRNYRLNGEVVQNVIKVYAEDPEIAKRVVLHEFLEHILKKQFSEPYMLLADMVSRAYDDMTYFRQEKVVEALVRLLSKKPRTAMLIEAGIVEDEN